jgi:hypothetical protein
VIKKFTQVLVILTGLINLNACSKLSEFTWREQVKLNDGRVIVVTQKRRCELAIQTRDNFGCIEREAWLTIDLPEFSATPMVWHEKLHPRIVNIHNGHLYIVGKPPTSRESRHYGMYAKPVPPYIGFVWENGLWKRLPFELIPEAIYDTNMLIEGIPPKGITLLTLKLKESHQVNGNLLYNKNQKRIDPNYIEKTVPQTKG